MTTRHEKIAEWLEAAIASCDDIKATCTKALALAQKGKEVDDKMLEELNQTEGEAQELVSEMGQVLVMIDGAEDD